MDTLKLNTHRVMGDERKLSAVGSSHSFALVLGPRARRVLWATHAQSEEGICSYLLSLSFSQLLDCNGLKE